MKQITDSALKAMWRKMKTLQDASYNLGKVPIDPPRFMGYKRTFILSEFANMRPDKDAIQRALGLCNTIKYSKDRKNFLADELAIKWGETHFNTDYQFLKAISKKEFEEMDLDAKTRKLFVQTEELHGYRTQTPRPVYIIEKPRALFTLKVSKHYLTEMQIMDSDLESQIAEIEGKFNTLHLYPRLGKLLGWSDHYYRFEIAKLKKDISNERYQEMLFDAMVENYDYATNFGD